MNKRDFLAALLAGGGISFLSSRLYDKYKNNQFSFSDLPGLDRFNPAIPDSTPVEELIAENMPSANSPAIIVAPENDLQEGFKHSERILSEAELDGLQEDEVSFYLEKFVTSMAIFPVTFI
jgi:hypothetical protein